MRRRRKGRAARNDADPISIWIIKFAKQLSLLAVAMMSLLFIAATSTAAPTAPKAAPHMFYVSPTGSDDALGSSPSSAFASLQKAQGAVRGLLAASGGAAAAEVHLGGGDYFNASLRLTELDSGAVTWRGPGAGAPPVRRCRWWCSCSCCCW